MFQPLGSKVAPLFLSLCLFSFFSVRGTRQNKELKDASLLVLNAEYVYCIHFNLQGKCFNFIQVEKEFHYLSGCFFVLNNHPGYLLKQFYTP